MAFATILDSFNRADENPLGNGTWSQDILTSDNALQILSNQVAGTSGASGMYWSAATFGPDCEAFVTVATRPGVSQNVVLALRLQSPGTAGVDGYLVAFARDASSNYSILLYRLDDNVTTQLGATIAGGAYSDGDKIGIAMIGDAFSAYVNTGSGWVLQGTRIDATYTTAGNIGLRLSDTTARGDDFGGGTGGDRAIKFAGTGGRFAGPEGGFAG